jgi:hypothetical protein
MKLTPLFALTAFALFGASASAADIRWSANDTFETTSSIAPGKVPPAQRISTYIVTLGRT